MSARLLLLALIACSHPACSQESLQKNLGDLELRGEWIYDDVDAGFAQAKKTGKPLMIVFR